MWETYVSQTLSTVCKVGGQRGGAAGIAPDAVTLHGRKQGREAFLGSPVCDQGRKASAQRCSFVHHSNPLTLSVLILETGD